MKKYLKIELILVFIILLLGLFLRVYKLESRTSFDADQEWLITRAQGVFQGDLPLLGPVTSVGAFSIGPGFVYLSALFSFFYQSDPVSLSVLSIFLGVLTLLFFYLFTRFFIDKRVAFLTLFLTSISFNLVFWDQNPWAPSLFHFSQVLLLIGAYLANKREVGYILIALGVVLGFQSHLGIVLSVISIVVYFIFVRPVKPKFKTLLIAILILFFGFLPNIVFDFYHNFINSKRLMNITDRDGRDYFVSAGKIIDTLAYNSTGHIYPRKENIFDNIIIKTIFALTIVYTLISLKNKKEKNLSLLLIITAFVPAIIFYIQQGKFSEYYLMMTFPSLIFMNALFLRRIIKNKLIIVFLIFISLYLNISKWYEFERSWSLGSKKDVIESIIDKGGKENYGISMSVRHGDQFGFNYLFDYYGIKADIPPKKGETKIFTIVIPEGFEGVYGLRDFGGIGLIWQGI